MTYTATHIRSLAANLHVMPVREDASKDQEFGPALRQLSGFSAALIHTRSRSNSAVVTIGGSVVHAIEKRLEGTS